jgi:hypothetical protein
MKSAALEGVSTPAEHADNAKNPRNKKSFMTNAHRKESAASEAREISEAEWAPRDGLRAPMSRCQRVGQ